MESGLTLHAGGGGHEEFVPPQHSYRANRRHFWPWARATGRSPREARAPLRNRETHRAMDSVTMRHGAW